MAPAILVMVSRFLVTTADERSWKFDRPVLFLGEWCRRYARRSIWAGMDAVVAAPYGLQPGQQERDVAYVQTLSGHLLGELARALNEVHGTSHSSRYWHIVVGHWLYRYVGAAFNRYSAVEQTLKTHRVSGTVLFGSGDYHLATSDSQSFVWACNDDVWNHVFYGAILAFFGGVEADTNQTALRGANGFRWAGRATVGAMTGKQRIMKLARGVLRRFSRTGDGLIVASYLPALREALLQLSLGQCPQLWRTPVPAVCAPNPEMRGRLELRPVRQGGFEKFVRAQLVKTLPTCFLEGYKHLVQQAESLPWPSEPRFVFTSNNFAEDDVFKAWTASMVERGVPYFAGQHGNNYGTARWTKAMPELVTCDKFFTWGWTDAGGRAVPAFIFKLAGRRRQRCAQDGGIVLIELYSPHRTMPWDTEYEFGLYQAEQFRFVEALPEGIRAQLSVRLHRGYRDHSWSDEERWKDRCPGALIDTGTGPIEALIARSRLVVHSYDSTGILETLAINIPTMCFWQGGLDHLLPTARPYYEGLRRAGILFDTPEDAAAAISSHWNDVGAWWASETVQRERRMFCDQFARTERHPVRTMRRLLTEQERVVRAGGGWSANVETPGRGRS